MKERFKILRKVLHLTQGEFAQKLGLQQNTICLFETDRRKPSDRTITDICQTFNVSENWLRTGNGEMFTNINTPIMEQLTKEFTLDEFDQGLVYEYLKLEPELRKAFREFFYKVLNRQSRLIQEPLISDELRQSVEEAERAYEKNLGIAPKTDLSVSNITDGTGIADKANLA